jgi:hypothetical protein
MQPAWARKFEPPAVTGGESQGVMRTLLMLYRQTQDRRYLKPVPRAIAYFRRSQLPNGQLARFYELKTNRPLYFTRQYVLTYDDHDLPTHYAFKVGSSIERIAREYERIAELDPAALKRETGARPAGKPSKKLVASVERVVDELDDRGRWVEDGHMKYHGDDDPTTRIIDCRTFVRNIGILCDYLNSKVDPIQPRSGERK